jgi:DNA processing protein
MTDARGRSVSIPDYIVATPKDFLGDLNEVEARYAPKQLYLAGHTDIMRRGPRVSIVGSRKASAEGMRRAKALCRRLAEHGVIVVSGLAAGIDRAAHEATIDACGSTVAVLGTPLDQYYPRDNRDLQDRIAHDHLLISQFAPSSPVERRNFPIRNRTMALLTDATVIVEAGEGSGSLYQGWEALRLGRLLFILESVASNSVLKWPADMISYGAQVLTRTNLSAMIEHLPPPVTGSIISAEA